MVLELVIIKQLLAQQIPSYYLHLLAQQTCRHLSSSCSTIARTRPACGHLRHLHDKWPPVSLLPREPAQHNEMPPTPQLSLISLHDAPLPRHRHELWLLLSSPAIPCSRRDELPLSCTTLDLIRQCPHQRRRLCGEPRGRQRGLPCVVVICFDVSRHATRHFSMNSALTRRTLERMTCGNQMSFSTWTNLGRLF